MRSRAHRVVVRVAAGGLSLGAVFGMPAAAADPTALLRKALAELEAEWPELHGCKEMLRSGGTVTPAEANNVSA